MPIPAKDQTLLPGKFETSPETLAYSAALETISRVAPEIADCILQELEDQRSYLKLIASENYSSPAVQLAMGNLLTDKYAEGYPFHRFYAGCDNVDKIEDLACRYACKLFGAEHAYVQPHSGADANLVALWAVVRECVQLPALEKLGAANLLDLPESDWFSIREQLCKQRLLGLDLNSGGHLTHGYRHNISAQIFESYTYGVNPETGLLDYADIENKLLKIRPLIFLAGYSAYPRLINFAKLRGLCDKAGAVLIVDMAHFAGLVAGGVFTGDYNPVPFAHLVTSTTHKTLRGPRGGLILCEKRFADSVDRGCPMILGGPLPHVMAAKAIAFVEASQPTFKQYAHQIVVNAKALAHGLEQKGCKIVTGGTDNHLVLMDVRPLGLTGRQAETALRTAGITLNRNTVPGDTNGPWYTSGLRFGTAAVTTLGMKEPEMADIATLIFDVISNTTPITTTSKTGATAPSKAKFQLSPAIQDRTKKQAKMLLERFPLYPTIQIASRASIMPTTSSSMIAEAPHIMNNVIIHTVADVHELESIDLNQTSHLVVTGKQSEIAQWLLHSLSGTKLYSITFVTAGAVPAEVTALASSTSHNPVFVVSNKDQVQALIAQLITNPFVAVLEALNAEEVSFSFLSGNPA